MASSEPPEIVATGCALAEMIRHVRDAGTFAFDSEFIGELSYVSRLCLIQVATTRKVFLVDPLAGVDLAGFWDLLTCPEAETIVLAGQQDLAPAVLRTSKGPANIMDVQIAAGFVHGQYPLSLARLVQEFVGVSLPKALAFTCWDRRPLSAVQVKYAADDVRFLPAAREAIGKRLTDLGRVAWAREECAAVLEDLSQYRPAPESLYLRVRGRDRLRRRNLAVLRELAIVRDRAARQEDVPARTLLRDGILVALASRPARTLADLDAIRGLPRPVEAKYGRWIVDATAKAMTLPEDCLPPVEPDDTPAMRKRVDEAWERISQFCLAQSIAPSLVASRKEVFHLCCAARAGEPLEQHRLGRGWRKEFLGPILASLL